MKHTLINKDGTLYFPHGGYTDNWNQERGQPAMLIRRYDAGDCDTIPWPLKSDFHDEESLKIRLARALYDERECNSFFGIHDEILLPDGTPFDFDTVLAEREHHSESPDYDPGQKPNY